MTIKDDYAFEFDFGFAVIQTMLHEAVGIEPDIGVLVRTLDELNIESLDIVNLAMDLERRFGVKLTDQETAELGSTTVGSLVDLMLSKQGIATGDGAILLKLRMIIEDVTEIEFTYISPEDSFIDDLGIDSVSMVDITVRCEKVFDIEIPDHELEKLKTVGDFTVYISRRTSKQPALQ